MKTAFGRPALLLTLFAAQPAFAHGGAEANRPLDVHQLLGAWEFDPIVVLGLILSAALYVMGTLRIWRTTRVGCGVGRFELSCFLGGWSALFLALVSPLHPWGRVLFSAHMGQHEVLMLVAAPLLVLSRPILPWLKALPSSWASALARAANGKVWRPFWSGVTQPFTAWAVHALALWIWHLPSLFSATIDNDWIHSFQHLSFLGSATLFWWAVLHGPRRALNYGAAVLYMFTTAMHSGLLGALLSCSNTVLYPVYANTTQDWGLTPIEDQQLGGLIMWVPAGLVYVFAALALFVGWLRESDRRLVASEAQPARVAP
jgi:putative membrane protein